MTQALPDLSPLPDIGDHMNIEEFIDAVHNGLFNDDDGTGFFATEDEMTDIEVLPSEILQGSVDKRWSHVMWFNK